MKKIVFLFLFCTTLVFNSLSQSVVEYQDQQLKASYSARFSIQLNDGIMSFKGSKGFFSTTIMFVNLNDNIYLRFPLGIENCGTCKLTKMNLFLEDMQTIKFLNSSFQEKENNITNYFFLIGKNDLELLKNKNILKIKFYVSGNESAFTSQPEYINVIADIKTVEKKEASKEDTEKYEYTPLASITRKNVLMTDSDFLSITPNFEGTSDLLKHFLNF